jgi:hypothetical protein
MARDVHLNIFANATSTALSGVQMKHSSINTIFAAVAVFLAVSVNAQTTRTGETSSTFPKATPSDMQTMSPHVGVKAGFASPEGSYDSAPEIGIDVGFQPYIPFGLGAAITTSKNTPKGAGRELERTSILARGTYNFGGSAPVIKNSWVGIAAGPVLRSNGTDIGMAPIVGFDIPMREASSNYLSLGADAKYLVMVNSDEADALSINGTVKYWF